MRELVKPMMLGVICVALPLLVCMQLAGFTVNESFGMACGLAFGVGFIISIVSTVKDIVKDIFVEKTDKIDGKYIRDEGIYLVGIEVMLGVAFLPVCSVLTFLYQMFKLI